MSSKKRQRTSNDNDERTILIQFYHSLGGESWTNKWDLDQNVNTFYGVELQNDQVISINLQNNNLTGTLINLRGLESLTSLHLQDNHITGPLIASLALHPQLISLNLARNNLQGIIPSSFVIAEQFVSQDLEDTDARELTLPVEIQIYDILSNIRHKRPFKSTFSTANELNISSTVRSVETLQQHPYFTNNNTTTDTNDPDETFLRNYVLFREWDTATQEDNTSTNKIFRFLDISVNPLTKFYRHTDETSKTSSSSSSPSTESILARTTIMSDSTPSNRLLSSSTSSSASSTPLPLLPLTQVMVTKNILTPSQCIEIIKYSENGGGWQTDRHKIYKTVDVDVRHIPLLLKLCNDILKNQILFVLASLFQLHVNDIVMDDLFVVKYSCGDAAINQTSLPPHQDDSVLSFVISLNNTDNYEGGGTEFVNWKSKNRISRPIDAGTMSSFCGLQLHSGKRITKGTRYILTGFLKVKDADNKTRKIGETLFPYPHGR